MGKHWQTALVTILACGLAAQVAYSQNPNQSQPTPQTSGQTPSLPPYAGPSQPPAAMPSPQKASAPIPSLNPYDQGEVPENDHFGSTYIPVDSWVYPAVLRLYSMGFVDTTFISMRPWTRRSLLHILLDSEDDIADSDNTEAQEILAKLLKYLSAETPTQGARGIVYGPETVYARMMGIGGTPLRDSFHLGQTLVNDYGRPYQHGFNTSLGFSSVNEVGRFSLDVRGEYQHAPAAAGYSNSLATYLSTVDQIVPYAPSNATIPEGPIAAQNPFRLVEATLSYHLLNHEISFGKSDSWLGPGQGGAMAWSDNAENIYSFRINRVEPLNIFLLSRLLGPVRYDFFVGSLKGHTRPNAPWVHSEMFAFRPTSNFEFGFQRTVIWGGHGHGCYLSNGSFDASCNEPITLHTFLKSFFDISDTTGAEKYSRSDPGARFSTFNFSWRLPFLSHHVTLYTDSLVHDDVTPPSAPRRAAYRPGLYISQIPGLPKLDFRVEAASTDTSTLRSEGGQFMYFETAQRQGYTNKGFITGDWIGREAKGGQAWLTWHLSGNESIQLAYLNKKTPKDFIEGGTTQNQFKVDVVKRLGRDVELEGCVQFERWKAPVYMTGPQSDTAAAARITWYPGLRTSTALNDR